MHRKLLHRFIVIVFFVVLAIRLEQHFRSPRLSGFFLETGNWVPPEECEHHIPLVLHIAANHTLRLNSESVSPNHLSARLAMILKERYLPVLYVDAGVQMTVQELAEFLDAAKRSNDRIHIRLVTPWKSKMYLRRLPTGSRVLTIALNSLLAKKTFLRELEAFNEFGNDAGDTLLRGLRK